LGKLLEDIHVTLTQFWKKLDKIATLHEEAQRSSYSVWRRRLNLLRHRQELARDGVSIPVTMSKRNHLNQALEDSVE
ncbi:hypothetical protein Tco_0764776, partial [Tanacetum coccineum]